MVKKDRKRKSYDRESFESAVEQLISKHDELKGRGFRQTNKCHLSLSLIESFLKGPITTEDNSEPCHSVLSEEVLSQLDVVEESTVSVTPHPTVSLVLMLSSLLSVRTPVTPPLLPLNPINRSFTPLPTPPPTLHCTAINKPSFVELTRSTRYTIDTLAQNPSKVQVQEHHPNPRPTVNLPIANIMMTSKVEVDEKTEKQIPDLIQVKATQLPDVQIIHNQDNDPAPDDSHDFLEQNSDDFPSDQLEASSGDKIPFDEISEDIMDNIQSDVEVEEKCADVCPMTLLKMKQLNHRIKSIERKWMSLIQSRESSILVELRGIRDQLVALMELSKTVVDDSSQLDVSDEAVAPESVSKNRQTIDLIKINKLYQMTEAVLSDSARQCVDTSVTSKPPRSDKQPLKSKEYDVPVLSTLNRCIQRQLFEKRRPSLEMITLNRHKLENKTLIYSTRQTVYVTFINRLRQLHNIILKRVLRPQVIAPIINKNLIEHKFELEHIDRETISLCISNKLAYRDWERVNELSVQEQRILYETKLNVQHLWQQRVKSLSDTTIVQMLAASATVLVLLTILSGSHSTFSDKFESFFQYTKTTKQ